MFFVWPNVWPHARTCRSDVGVDHHQLMQLREKLHAEPPHWAAVSPMFDEATARRMIKVVKRSVHATIHSFVLLVCFSWGFANSTAVHTYQCIIPPIMLARVTAVALWDALRTHPFTKVIWEFWQFLLGTAQRLPITLWSALLHTERSRHFITSKSLLVLLLSRSSARITRISSGSCIRR